MKGKLKVQSVAVSLAVFSALFMLVLWVLANAGLYVSAANQMARWHMFFDLSLMGLVGGMIEAAIMSIVLVYSFVWIYNFVVKI